MVQFKTGHCSANYSKWFEFNKETQNIARYDERFNEYGFNKIVHIKGLGVVDRHSFNVLNDGFIFFIIKCNVKRCILKLVEIKMEGKEANEQNMLDRVCKQVMVVWMRMFVFCDRFVSDPDKYITCDDVVTIAERK